MVTGCCAFLRMHGGLGGKSMLENELQRIYESEINVRISWLWDGAIDVRLGATDPETGSPPTVPAGDQWRSGAMPGLRRATCSSGWHGGGIRVCLLALRKGCGSTAA